MHPILIDAIVADRQRELLAQAEQRRMVRAARDAAATRSPLYTRFAQALRTRAQRRRRRRAQPSATGQVAVVE